MIPPRSLPLIRKADEPNFKFPIIFQVPVVQTLWPHFPTRKSSPIPLPPSVPHMATLTESNSQSTWKIGRAPRGNSSYNLWFSETKMLVPRGIPPKKKHIAPHSCHWWSCSCWIPLPPVDYGWPSAESQGGLLEMEKYHGNLRGLSPKCYPLQEMAGLIEGWWWLMNP